MEEADIVYSYTLYDLFETWWFVPYPHFAVLLIATICVETYSRLKDAAIECSIALVGLSTITGISLHVFAIIAAGTAFYPGDRMAMPWSYYLAVSSLALAAGLIFILGFQKDLARKRYIIATLRGIVFWAALVIFAITFVGPYRMDKELERWEKTLDQDGR